MNRKVITILIPALFLFFNLKGQILNVTSVTQEQNQWCWAGSTACILNYYNFPVTQCTIADYTRSVATWYNFGSTPCCTNPNLGCNYWNYLYGSAGSIEDILKHFSGLTNQSYGNALNELTITSCLQLNRLFVIRWGWSTGGGHFVVGHGISGDNIYYMDPWYGEGKKIATYAWVCSDGNHTWTHSVFMTETPCTEPPAQPGNITGPTDICKGDKNVTYSIIAVPGALSYTWTLPEGATGSSLTNSITLNYDQSFVLGNISVKARNLCGDGAPSTLQVNAKQCSADNTYSIFGTVNYDNSNLTPLSNVDLTLKNSEKTIIGLTSTDINGKYRFNNIQNGTYSLSISTKRKDVKFTPTDALLINKYFVMTYNFADTMKMKAADVTLDNLINPTDALSINRRFVSITTSFKAGDWLFFGNKDIIIDRSDKVNDFKGICVGDVRGAYIPTSK